MKTELEGDEDFIAKDFDVLRDLSVPFGQALPVGVVVPVEKHGKCDDFIDDIIGCGYFNSRWKRLAGAALLSLYVVGRPVSVDEPLARDDLVALKKFKAEGALSEIQTVLGWDVDTRRFITIRPDLKHAD